MAAGRPAFRRLMIMMTLIIAGESVFILPFVLARIFRPTLLDVFGLTNLELGIAFSVYGIVAMVSYFLGGPLADTFSARRLMTAALVLTAQGGIMFAFIPDLSLLMWLYAFWGMTTILLFWAALIRATREWGGSKQQGQAYGILDGGRGLVAALLASLSVFVFSLFLPEDASTASLEERTTALSWIIWMFTGVVLGVAFLVWIFVPDSQADQRVEKPKGLNLTGMRRVIRLPGVWLQAVIVVCAYVGYKGIDDFSLYARDAFGYDDVAAAQIGTIAFWIRPFAAVAAGYLGDIVSSSRVILWSFGVILLGSLAIAMGALQPGMYGILILTIAGTSVGIYAIRGVYFALFQEANVPLVFTGSAVGLVSVIGYTPDIFMGPLMGYLIDRSPGALGHQHVFAVLAAFALVGFTATLLFRRYGRRLAT